MLQGAERIHGETKGSQPEKAMPNPRVQAPQAIPFLRSAKVLLTSKARSSLE